jgi:type IV pilus assembly protein PilM
MTLEEVSEAIKWETEQQIPLSLEEIYLDWYVLENDSLSKKEKKKKKEKEKKSDKSKAVSQKVKVFLTAAPRSLVDSYVKVLKKAELKPIAMEVESAAAARALIDETKYKNNVLIIDSGEMRTSFIIFKSPVIRFTRSVGFSGASLTDEISKKLKVSRQEAELLKKKWGLGKEEGGGSLRECLEPLFGDLSKKIQESLEYYSEHFEKESLDGKINKIILCGGGAKLKEFDSWLSSKAKREVEKIDPWIKISSLLPDKKISFPKDHCYATAIGLALRGIKGY